MAKAAVTERAQLSMVDEPLEETPLLIRLIQEYFDCDVECKENKEKIAIAARLQKQRKDAKDKVFEQLPPTGSVPHNFKIGNVVISVQPGGETKSSTRISKPRVAIKRELPPQ